MSCAYSDRKNQELLEKTEKHPCYSAEAHHKYARMHLPVAPRCNIQCNYCNRKFDCVNESRPGVTSEVLTPELAREKFTWVKEEIKDLTVIGIAGPGDALAEWDLTKKTIEEIKEIDSSVIFCLSTNGLLLPEYAAEIIELGIQHVTVTVNTLDPEIGAKIYKHVLFKGVKYVGAAAAELLLKNQLEGIQYLTDHGIFVKINMVMIKGINDHHIPFVVKKMKELGVFVTNIMPLIPAPGSAFETFPQTSMKEINDLRNLCQLDIQQMRHCQQCRADAIGRLGEDRSQEFRMGSRNKAKPPAANISKKQYKIAVTSKYGKLVDLHFGHATEFTIYQTDGESITLLGNRQVEKYCHGMEDCDSEEVRRDHISDALQDCDAVLTMRIGYHAKEKFKKRGIPILEFCDTVESGLHFAVNQLLAANPQEKKEELLDERVSS